MKPLIILSGIVVVVGLIFAAWTMGSYNDMVEKRAKVETAWSQVETQYQRRFDLVPQLVGATKGFLAQEQAVFGAIADARTHYANSAPNTNERVQATNQYEGALSRLLVVMENYPQLKSDATVRGLTDELTGTANRINVAQQRYNETAQVYNVSIKSFPRNILAGMFGFTEKTLFQAETGANKAPTVNLEIQK